jgi:sugar/nucleoside kinase (ribokinase family)
VSNVGRDREGDLLLETMRTEGTDVAAVTRVDEPTGTTREPSMPTYEEIDVRAGQ